MYLDPWWNSFLPTIRFPKSWWRSTKTWLSWNKRLTQPAWHLMFHQPFSQNKTKVLDFSLTDDIWHLKNENNGTLCPPKQENIKIYQRKIWKKDNFVLLGKLLDILILNTHIQGTTMWKLTSWGFQICETYWVWEFLNGKYCCSKSE